MMYLKRVLWVLNDCDRHVLYVCLQKERYLFNWMFNFIEQQQLPKLHGGLRTAITNR